MAKELIFVVDDDPNLRRILSVLLETRGYTVRSFETGEACLEALDENPAAVFLDLTMPGMGGMQALKEVKKLKKDLPVIMVTSVDDVETAVSAIKEGAFDYILKPFDEERLITDLTKALRENDLKHQVHHLQNELKDQHDLKEFVGKSLALERIAEKINKVKDSNASVLIQGESGTGKELVARAIHYNSCFAAGLFVDINCGAIPDTLQESELFGHKKGAFTGADESRTGKLELANGGTLFLDEVAEMSPSTQTKFLRFLQEKNFERIGENTKIYVKTRVIAATNKDLLQEVEKGNFREDLYYRLAVFPIHVPPLRERKEDIPLLCFHFLQKYKNDLQKEVKSIHPKAMEILISHPWPGNIRQLENAIYQAMINTETDCIESNSLPEEVLAWNSKKMKTSLNPREPRNESLPSSSGKIIPFEEVEKQAISEALKITHGNVPEAANQLGISRSTLYRLVKKYGLR